MAAVRPIRATNPEPVGLHTQAMDNLRFIRLAMENAGSFTAVPGVGGMLMGATALFAAFAAHLSRGPRAWLGIWSGEALLALAIGMAFSYRKAMRGGAPLLSKPFRRPSRYESCLSWGFAFYASARSRRLHRRRGRTPCSRRVSAVFTSFSDS
jgi:hypothetical protein